MAVAKGNGLDECTIVLPVAPKRPPPKSQAAEVKELQVEADRSDPRNMSRQTRVVRAYLHASHLSLAETTLSTRETLGAFAGTVEARLRCAFKRQRKLAELQA